LPFGRLLELLDLSTQPFVLLFEFINAPIALIDPPVALRDLLFQVRDAWLLALRPFHVLGEFWR